MKDTESEPMKLVVWGSGYILTWFVSEWEVHEWA